MNQQQLKQLRAENKHEEAYKNTQSVYAEKNNDIWAIRNHAWSLYYMTKKHVQAGENQQASNFLKEFENMRIPEEEALIHERFSYFHKVLQADYLKAKSLVEEGKYSESFDLLIGNSATDAEQLAWTVFYLLRAFNKTGNQSISEVFKKLDQFKEQVVPEKKLVFKLILQQLIKIPENLWSGRQQSTYLEYLMLFEILEEEDFQMQDWEGKKLMSLAERLHISYSKALLREESNPEKIQNYIVNVVEGLLEQFSGMQYVPYFKAKLLLGLGKNEVGLAAFLPFAKKKASEFWVWQVFAEAYESNEDIYFSCLCKALTCRTKPEFLLGIKERILDFLIKNERFEEAKSVLDDILRIRQDHGWGTRSKHQQLLDTDWYQSSQARKIDYESNKSKAEGLLKSTQEMVIHVIVSHINESKQVFGFLTEEKKQGFSKYNRKPELWSCYRLYGEYSTGDFFQLRKMEKADFSQVLTKEISGTLKIAVGKPFGFIDQVFVKPELVKIHELKNGDRIRALAVLQPVKGKTDWGWGVVRIIGAE